MVAPTDPFKSPVAGPMVVLASTAPRFVISIPPTCWQLERLLFCADATEIESVIAAKIENTEIAFLNCINPPIENLNVLKPGPGSRNLEIRVANRPPSRKPFGRLDRFVGHRCSHGF